MAFWNIALYTFTEQKSGYLENLTEFVSFLGRKKLT